MKRLNNIHPLFPLELSKICFISSTIVNINKLLPLDSTHTHTRAHATIYTIDKQKSRPLASNSSDKLAESTRVDAGVKQCIQRRWRWSARDCERSLDREWPGWNLPEKSYYALACRVYVCERLFISNCPWPGALRIKKGIDSSARNSTWKRRKIWKKFMRKYC